MKSKSLFYCARSSGTALACSPLVPAPRALLLLLFLLCPLHGHCSCLLPSCARFTGTTLALLSPVPAPRALLLLAPLLCPLLGHCSCSSFSCARSSGTALASLPPCARSHTGTNKIIPHEALKASFHLKIPAKSSVRIFGRCFS